MKAKENLYLNEDRTKLVLEDSPEQAFTLVGKGGEIPQWAIERFKLNDTSSEEAEKINKGRMPPPVPTKSQPSTEKKLKAGAPENK